jgi:manganese transport system permease protein
MLVTPGATAFLLTDRFDRMNLYAVALAMLATGLGVIVSYWLDASTAGCIVLVQTGLFLVTMVLAPRHGLLARHRPPRP